VVFPLLGGGGGGVVWFGVFFLGGGGGGGGVVFFFGGGGGVFFSSSSFRDRLTSFLCLFSLTGSDGVPFYEKTRRSLLLFYSEKRRYSPLERSSFSWKRRGLFFLTGWGLEIVPTGGPFGFIFPFFSSCY